MNGRERLFDLLADRATQALGAEEHVELSRLLREHSDVDPEALDRVAAALDLSLAAPATEPLPALLRARIERAAFGAAGPRASARAQRRALFGGVGWAVAAGLLLFLLGRGGPPAPIPAAPAEARAALLASTPDARAIAWTRTQDPAAANAEGDVVWSDSRQEGYLRFRGLPANDPRASQYQLWIFDAERDERYPVDGGVFDVAAAGETVVPIRARLPVARATLFAITVEKPGGVVVSDRSRLPLLAKVEG